MERVTIATMARIPRLDWFVAASVTVLGLAMTLGGGEEQATGTIVDSIVVPAVTLPLLWRRMAPFAAVTAFAVGTVVSGLPTFAQSRCGVALPVALVLVYSLAVRSAGRRAVVGLGLVMTGVVVLVLTDPLLDAIALFFLVLCAALWAAGRVVRSRDHLAAELAERAQALLQTQEHRARVAVELDRMLIAADLDVATSGRLRTIVDLAQTGMDQPPATARDTFARIEHQGRGALDAMREMLGRLRSADVATAPQPTFADLEQLITRQRQAGVAVEVRTSGEPRPLPAAVELTGYRVVEHGLQVVLAKRVEIALRYLPDAVELELRGHEATGASAESALAAARERITAHGGHFSHERDAHGACVLRGRLPVAATHA